MELNYTIYRDEWKDKSAVLVASISLAQLINRFLKLDRRKGYKGRFKIDVELEILEGESK